MQNKREKEEQKEVAVYTAESSAIAEMLVGKLENLDIPARIGVESASAGVFGLSGAGRTILVPEKFAPLAKEILNTK